MYTFICNKIHAYTYRYVCTYVSKGSNFAGAKLKILFTRSELLLEATSEWLSFHFEFLLRARCKFYMLNLDEG